MRIPRVAVIGAATLAVTATALTAAQLASANDFDVTANGVSNRGTIADLPPSSQVSLAVSNLPAGVGLYAFHCLVPKSGTSLVPTRCDDGDGTLVYIVASSESQTVTRAIRTNAEFLGKNPNDLSPDQGTTQVNCRVDACAIYTLGAGRESANPAYVTVFRTQFTEVGPRLKDRAVVQLNGKTVKPGRERVVSYSEPKSLTVTLASGQSPSLFSKKCDVRGGQIRALTERGSCNVRITSTGNDDYRPLTATVTFKIKK